MSVVPLVLAGHLLGDWIIQTDWQAANKASSWRAMHAHCLTYHTTLGVVVAPVWHDWRLAVLLIASYATHAIIDRRWPVRWLLRTTGSPQFANQMWGVLAADQALHLSILLIAVAVLA